MTEFYLAQNYPNPFNPSTIINYELPIIPKGTPNGANSVKLIVYNTLGQIVQTLVNEKQEPGKHTVIFNATGLASGVYFYTLKAGTFLFTKKMLLMR